MPTNALKRGATRSCGKHRKYFSNRGDRNPQYTGYREITGSFWSKLKRRCSIRGLGFNLDIKEAWQLYEKQNGLCALSGVEIFFPRGGGAQRIHGTASLDRIDPTLGYISGNVRWLHKHVNIMRNIYHDDYFIDMCRKIVALKGGKI